MLALQMIEDFYGDRKAERSGVPLINHIYEGKAWLEYILARHTTIDAFCLHPIIQNDSDLHQNWGKIIRADFDNDIIMFLMEYRNIANLGLRPSVMPEKFCPQDSPLNHVNDMLRADKIQNRKDFYKYYRGRAYDTFQLEEYFAAWMRALGVGDKMYEKAVEIMTNVSTPTH